MVILGKTKIKNALDKYPELKEVLIGYSSKFKKLNNKLIFNTIAKWATFNDVAKIGNISICDLLHTLNSTIGEEKNLTKKFPDCVKESEMKTEKERPDWYKNVKQFVLFDVRNIDGYFFPEIISKLNKLEDGQALTVINDFEPIPLMRMFEEKGNKFYGETVNGDEYHLTILYQQSKSGIDSKIDWKKQLDLFPELNVIGMLKDPFELIIKKAQSIEAGQGFVLIQAFQPDPLINLLKQMGFETYIKKEEEMKYKMYFYKPISKKTSKVKGKKVPVVIQSATPTTYPIIMKMLQSEELMSRIEIQELKVWEETEKHMAWIVNGKADISFSAVAAASKLFLVGSDIKMMSVDIWDNFSILTRGYKANNFGDLKGHKIHMPLFKEAPPAAVTNYLMKETGYDPEDFDFYYGRPFGRPKTIMNDFISGKADTVLLREPESSFALFHADQDAFHSISYTDIWKKINNKDIKLPNAGLILKGEFLKNYPDIAKLFIKVMKEAIDWINNNKKESAKMAFDIMGQSPEAIEFFLNRAHFEHIPTSETKDELFEYIKVVDKKAAKNLDQIKGLFL
ncbi:MAG: DUF2249 domain-containing protein [Candidatus Marinimicrobia bacterium]|nr:DUF2249 domain-containing protein [Candidatus Neomarinimicrobiota bacterium]